MSRMFGTMLTSVRPGGGNALYGGVTNSRCLLPMRDMQSASCELVNQFAIGWQKVQFEECFRAPPLDFLEDEISYLARFGDRGEEYKFDRFGHLRVLVARAIDFGTDFRCNTQFFLKLAFERRFKRFSGLLLLPPKFPHQLKTRRRRRRWHTEQLCQFAFD